MRAFNVRTIPLVLSLAGLVAACAAGPAGGPGGHRGPGGPFGSAQPPRPALFISPFGEAFVGEPGQPWPSADWFIGADADLDGAITLAEFTADGQRYFAVLDTDGDGRLNQTELAAYEQGLRRFGSAMGGPGGRPGGARPGSERNGGERNGGQPGRGMLADGSSTLGIAPQEPPEESRLTRRPAGRPQGYGTIAESGFFNLPQPVKSADTNVDQRVTGEEWAVATQRWFWSLDTDRDGKLTLATLPVTPAQAAAARRR